MNDMALSQIACGLSSFCKHFTSSTHYGLKKRSFQPWTLRIYPPKLKETDIVRMEVDLCWIWVIYFGLRCFIACKRDFWFLTLLFLDLLVLLGFLHLKDWDIIFSGLRICKKIDLKLMIRLLKVHKTRDEGLLMCRFRVY